MPHPSPDSPLIDLHRRLDAELQSYDALDIVSTFGEPQAEYAAIRKATGLFDMPQRGVVELTGKDRHAFLNNLVSNQIFDKSAKAGIAAGQRVYAYLLNLKGRIVCDMNVIETGDRLLLEVDARLTAMLVTLFGRYLFSEAVQVRDASADLYEIALHGPTAPSLLADEGVDASLGVNDCRTVSLIGISFTLWRDDVCGVPGLHLILPRDRTADVWQHLLTRHGVETTIGKRALRPVGWAAFNATRIEAGRVLFGIDIEPAPPAVPGKKADAEADDTTARPVGVLPAELPAIDDAVSFTKGCYLGQEVVARMHARKVVARQWVGLRIDDEALPVSGTQVFDDDGAVVGMVTSSTMSPVLSDASIALAVVRKPLFEPGRRLRVAAEGAVRGATVVSLPFLQSETA